MNVPVQSLDVRRVISEHVVEVFKTMLSLPVTPLPLASLPHFGERVTGSVGFGGDLVTGAIYLHTSAEQALRLAGAMLGLAPEELGESEVNDVIGEISNMITGQLKSFLCDAGAPCAVSTPAIIRGASYEIEYPEGVRREMFLFECAAAPIAVELHIKFN